MPGRTELEHHRLDREAEARNRGNFQRAREHAHFVSRRARAAPNQTHSDSDPESVDWDEARSHAATYVASLRANPIFAEAILHRWRPVLPTERILYGDEIVGQSGYTMSVIRRTDIS